MRSDGRELPDKRSFALPDASQRTWIRPDGSVYRIMLWKPKGEAPAAGYPAIYVLDANSVFGTVAEAVRLQTRGPHRLADAAVVVGIGYETDEPFETDRRFYDYAVHADENELPPRRDGKPWPATGGANDFLAFLEDELKPVIEREVAIDRSRQSLFGHSLGGLFALHALFSGRGNYRFYAAGSPSIWWKNRWIAGEALRWIEDKRRRLAMETDTRLLLAVGGEEHPHMIEDARQLYDRLSEAKLPGVRAEIRLYSEESHISVLLPFLARAIRMALKL